MMHVAVLKKKYIELILDGTKRIECRLTKQARAPYGVIERGETIFIKQSGGPYRAVAKAGRVMCEGGLTPSRIREVRRVYGALLGGGGDKFWTMKSDCNYLTLIWLEDVIATDLGPKLKPLQGRAWVTMEEVTKPI